MESRRNFIGQVATGVATGTFLTAADRVRAGIIGFGDRGAELANHIRACPNAELAAVSDVFNRHLERATSLGAAAYSDYRRMLDDRSIDAVIVATPQHLHAEQFCAALAAGKHVYQERTMAFTVEHARAMRTALGNSGRIVQVGHQACSSAQMSDVRHFLSDRRRMGRITAIRMDHFRNSPAGKPQWSRAARMTADVNARNVDWRAFLGDAPAREFDARRYVNWRLYSDYSGGSVSENMSQQIAFWYQALNLQIPRAASMRGGIYLWKDGREIPDTMTVALEQPEDLLITWNSGFGNNHPGIVEDVLGDHGTISRSHQVRYLPQKINRPEGNEMAGRLTSVPHAHMQNFFDAIRGAAKPNCPFETGYRVSIACRMALESHRLGRTVYWDAAKEEIV
ncbi:MAG TPA: Gfo/Idh/MocA family oxidoreductase [Bryobacteraceae bacterium]|nr:Gfo/Idh/MocA family oxidoreductase [Bryobacteraceae bacterium]